MSDDGGGKFGGIIGSIVVVGILNLLSYLFDWGWYFW